PCRQRPSRSRRASTVVQADAVDERLVVLRLSARRDGSRLTMRLASELGRAHIRHPDLHWAQALGAEATTVLTHSLLDAGVLRWGCHNDNVTCNANARAVSRHHRVIRLGPDRWDTLERM